MQLISHVELLDLLIIKMFLSIYYPFSQKAIIKAGILKNDFMKNLEHAQIREIVACMKPEHRKAGDWVIKEGDPGQTLFALAGTWYSFRGQF